MTLDENPLKAYGNTASSELNYPIHPDHKFKSSQMSIKSHSQSNLEVIPRYDTDSSYNVQTKLRLGLQ